METRIINYSNFVRCLEKLFLILHQI